MPSPSQLLAGVKKKANAPILPTIQQTGPGVPGAPAQYGPVGSMPFTASQNLVGQQFTPGMSPDTTAARQQVSQSLGSLQGPDRGQLAAQTFQQLRDLSEPGYQQNLRQVGQKAAALGRIGAGMTTSELGDVASNREKYLGTLQQQLATESAGQTLQDRLNTLGAGQGVLGQLSGMDQQQYQNLFGERGYQSGLQQQAFLNSQGTLGLLAGLGFGGNNKDIQQALANQYAQQAMGSQASSAELFRLLQQNQQRRTGQSPPTDASGGGLG